MQAMVVVLAGICSASAKEHGDRLRGAASDRLKKLDGEAFIVNDADAGDETKGLLNPKSSSTSQGLGASADCALYQFTDLADLKEAVDLYISENCHEHGGNSTCAAGQKYGWPINAWCVSGVTDMSALFSFKEDFNEDISSWDTSSVTRMAKMFKVAKQFDSDISGWNVSQVRTFGGMFNNATAFARDISGWNFHPRASMNRMFYGADLFNQNLCK